MLCRYAHVLWLLRGPTFRQVRQVPAIGPLAAAGEAGVAAASFTTQPEAILVLLRLRRLLLLLARRQVESHRPAAAAVALRQGNH